MVGVCLFKLKAVLVPIIIDISPFIQYTKTTLHFIYHSFAFLTLYPATWLFKHKTRHSHYYIKKNGRLRPVRSRPWLFQPFFFHILAPVIGFFLAKTCNIFHWLTLCYQRYRGPQDTTHHLHPSRWRNRHAFPSSWMVLSCIMLSNYTASMFLCCDCYGTKSNMTIRLDFDNILRPDLLSSFIPLPSRYKWYDSRHARLKLKESNQQEILQWRKDSFHQNRWTSARLSGSCVAVYFESCSNLDLDIDNLTGPSPFKPTDCSPFPPPPAAPPDVPDDTPPRDRTDVRPQDFNIHLSSQKSYKQRLFERYGDLSNIEWSTHYTALTSNPSFMLSTRQDPNTTLVPVVMDTGCSFAVTFSPADYYCPPNYGDFGNIKQVDGTKSNITAYGIGAFQVPNNKGELVTMTMPMFLVPNCKQRLMSPQDYAAFHGFDRSFDTKAYGGNSAFFSIHLQDDNGVFTVNIDSASNIPIAMMEPLSISRRPSVKTALAHAAHLQAQVPISSDASENDTTNKHHDATAALDILDEENENLTQAQKTLLLDHQRLGHINMPHLQTLYKNHRVDCDFDGCSKDVGTACLPARHRSVSTCSIPLCFACRQAKAKKRPTSAKHNKDVPSRQGVLSRDKLKPGERVSLDQYQSSIRGRRYETAGKESERHKYVGGTIFYDHASGLILCYHQESLSAADTLKSKKLFEQECAKHGISVQSYHTDNGVFTTNELQNDLLSKNQTDTYSGVGAKHMNGCAERSIQTVVNSARAMMIHAHTRWPDENDPDLWPFAMSYAAWLHNHIPSSTTHLAPLEIFTETKMNCEYLRRAKVFGCPSYVLDPRLQDGHKLPKWEIRARLAQFLGFNPKYSSTVGIVRNIATGYCSTQFHVVYDQLFTTVASSRLVDLTETWIDLLQTSRENLASELDEKLPPFDPVWLPPDELPASSTRHSNKRHRPTHQEAPMDDSSSSSSSTSSDDNNDDVTGFHDEPTPAAPHDERDAPLPHSIQLPAGSPDYQNQGELGPPKQGEPAPPHKLQSPSPSSTPIKQPVLRRSHRQQRPNVRFKEFVNHDVIDFEDDDIADMFSIPRTPHLPSPDRWIDWHSTPKLTKDSIVNTFNAMLDHMTCPLTGEIHYQHPWMYAARLRTQKEFEPTYREICGMPEGPTKDGWLESMKTEADTIFHKRQAFKLVPKDPTKHLIPLMWRFITKFLPDGSEKKKKARLVVRGDLQRETTNKADTYSPVVGFDTVRLFHNLCIQLNLHTVQIDFNAAFLQSDLPEPLYLQVPPPYCNHDYFQDKMIECTKSCYGDCRSSALWWKLLLSSLEDCGFTPSPFDQCLLLRHDCMMILYCDDVIFATKQENKHVPGEIMDKLKLAGLDFDREDTGTINTYLGIDLDPVDPTTLKMSQRRLTQRIIDALNLGDSAPKPTPSASILGKHEDEPLFDNKAFNYRSVLGMLHYLTGNTRPDLAFAVSQCARFQQAPRQSHAAALKRIGRYLLHTVDKGMIIKKIPLGDQLTLDLAVDADFAGLWNPQEADDASNCRSRTGFVIMLGGSPIYWYSKLQDCISLNTMESEYLALSTAMKPLLHFRNMYFHISETMSLPFSRESRITTIFEDNQACIALATTDPPRLTPRSKHIAVRYHWFRSHLQGPNSEIRIQYIPSELNPADIFTKPLVKETFERCRFLTLGW